MSIHDRLREVFREALELPADAEVESLGQRDHPRWDSLGHLALVAAIEDEFDVELDTDQLIDMTSFELAVKILQDLRVEDR